MLYQKEGMLYRNGTIIPRKRKDGSIAHMAQIVIKREGKTVYRQTQTFDRRPAAVAWIKRREEELSKPEALVGIQRNRNALLKDAIDRYIAESRKEIGRTKAQVLNAIKKYDIADIPCADVRSEPSRITSHTLVRSSKSRELRGATNSNLRR